MDDTLQLAVGIPVALAAALTVIWYSVQLWQKMSKHGQGFALGIIGAGLILGGVLMANSGYYLDNGWLLAPVPLVCTLGGFLLRMGYDWLGDG